MILKGFVIACFPFFQQCNQRRLLSEECLNESIISGRSFASGNVTLFDCSFSRLQYLSGNGGVIFLAASFIFRVYSCMFYSCLADFGGAIHITVSDSQISMICAHRCNGIQYYHFGYLKATGNNLVEYHSMSSCSNNSIGMMSLCTDYGDQSLCNMNSSYNKGSHYSGIYMGNPSSLSGIHCTFYFNQPSGHSCITFIAYSGTLSFCNVVSNISPNGFGIVFVRSGAYYLKYCIFNNNSNTLFHVDANTLSVSDSFINHTGTKFIGAVTYSQNNTYIGLSTYQQKFFKSFYCYADQPKNEIFQSSPYRSYDEKCEIHTEPVYIEQNRIGSVFSYSYLFLLNT